jgi:SAM-dependent methyltransferase
VLILVRIVTMLTDLYRWFAMNLRYFGRPPWDTGQSPPELIEFICSHKAGKALDLGCGTGTNCLTLAEAGWQTTGVDLAWKALLKARSRFTGHNLTGDFHAGSVLNFKAPADSFDLLLDIGCFHSLTEPAREVYREKLVTWLKPGGHFLIYAHRNWPGRPDSTHLTDMEITRFQTELSLVSRNDCVDRIGRKTIWLLFTKADR